MKKLLLVVLVGLALAIYAGSSRYGFALGGVRVSLSPIKQLLDEKARGFLTDIQYKDFERAAQHHSEEDQAKKDIPKLIEAKFHVKPEALDIRHFEVLRVDLAPTNDRAKAVCTVTVVYLNAPASLGISGPKDYDVVLYFKKADDGQWWMDLQSSL